MYLIYDYFITSSNEDLRNPRNSNLLPILGGVTIVLSIITSVIIVSTDRNSKINHMTSMVKYFSKLFFIIYTLIEISVNYRNFANLTFTRVFIIGYSLSWFEFNFLKYYSKFIALFTFIGFLSIALFDSFTTKNLKIQYNDNTSKRLFYSCSIFDTFNTKNLDQITDPTFLSLYKNEDDKEYNDVNMYILKLTNQDDSQVNSYLYNCTLQYFIHMHYDIQILKNFHETRKFSLESGVQYLEIIVSVLLYLTFIYCNGQFSSMKDLFIQIVNNFMFCKQIV